MDEFPKALYHATDPTSPRVVQSKEDETRLVADGWTVTSNGSAPVVVPPVASEPETDDFAKDLAANEAAADAAGKKADAAAKKMSSHGKK